MRPKNNKKCEIGFVGCRIIEKFGLALMMVWGFLAPLQAHALLECGAEQTCMVESVAVPVGQGLECVAAVDAAAFQKQAYYEGKGWYPGCQLSCCADPDSCNIIKCEVWCNDCRPNVDSIEQVITDSSYVTGVTAGEEKAAAEAFADQWFQANNYPAVADRVRTDAGKGLAYTSSIDENGDVTLAVTVWKRGSFTKAGANSIPLSDLTGVGGGGGGTVNIDYQQMADAVAGGIASETGQLAMESHVHEGTLWALADAGLTDDYRLGNDRMTTFGALEDAFNAGYIGPGGGGSTAITAAEMESILAGQFNTEGNTIGSLSGALTHDPGTRRQQILDGISGDVGTAFDDFKETIQGTDLYGLIDGFFGAIPSGGSVSSEAFDGGVYGTHSFDYSNLAGPLTAVRGVILLAAVFVSLRIVILKGGSS
jgi:hypothetical protein